MVRDDGAGRRTMGKGDWLTIGLSLLDGEFDGTVDLSIDQSDDLTPGDT